MTSRSIFLGLVLLTLGCAGEATLPTKPCAAEVQGTWVTSEGSPVLACGGDALAIAITGPSQQIFADDRTLLNVRLRVGRDFALSAAQVELIATGGVFPSAGTSSDNSVQEPSRTVVWTDGNGTASTVLRVGSTARKLVLHGRVTGHANAADAGAGLVDTVVYLDLAPVEVSKTILSTSGAPELQPGGSVELTLRGYADEALQVPAGKATLELCLQGQPGLSANATEWILAGDGSSKAMVLASREMDSSGKVTIRACPASVQCKDSPACGTLELTVKPAVRPVRKIALSIDSPSMKVGDTRTITAFAYTDPAYLFPAAKGTALRFCASHPGVLTSNLGQLDESGKTTVQLRALSATTSEPVRVSACPYELDCTITPLPETCSPALLQSVSAPDPAIASMVITFAAPPFKEGQAGSVTIAAYSNQARTVPSPQNHPVRYCVDPARATLSSTAGFLNASGQATVTLTPLPGSAAGGPLAFTACPYDVSCGATDASCRTESVAIAAPTPG
jgi:hypothetical protein